MDAESTDCDNKTKLQNYWNSFESKPPPGQPPATGASDTKSTRSIENLKASELQKRKKLAPTNFLTQKISTKTRDLRHFQIRDKIA